MSEQYYNPSHKLNIIVYKKYLEEPASDALLSSILTDPQHFKHPVITKAGQPSKKRNKTIYGDINEYVITYRGKIIKTPVFPWKEEFKEIRDKITKTTEQQYNTCVLQIYNSGQVGIKPHKDKEMNEGTKIASISLG